MTLAIFDLDNTLIAGDSDHAWGEFLVEEGIVDAHTYKQANDLFYQQYLNGELDIFHYQSFVLEPLTRHEPAQLEAWRDKFLATKVRPMLLDKAISTLDHHRAQGHTLLIITATNRFITQPIAELLGIDNLIATEPEVVDGRFTGRIAGTPSFQEGKVQRLNHWLAEREASMAGAWFYSDSHNDLPLLKQVSNPVAVDPDPTLAQYAEAQGWPIISLRD